jgi:hypothetical protein
MNKHTSTDSFRIKVEGQKVCAARLDRDAGWTMNLQIACLIDLSPDDDAELDDAAAIEVDRDSEDDDSGDGLDLELEDVGIRKQVRRKREHKPLKKRVRAVAGASIEIERTIGAHLVGTQSRGYSDPLVDQRCTGEKYTEDPAVQCDGWTGGSEEDCWLKCQNNTQAPNCPAKHCAASEYFAEFGVCHHYAACGGLVAATGFTTRRKVAQTCNWVDLGQIALSHSFDTTSEDMPGYNPYDAQYTSAVKCQELCQSLIDCKGYSWRAGDSSHIHYHKCFLFSRVGVGNKRNLDFTSSRCALPAQRYCGWRSEDGPSADNCTGQGATVTSSTCQRSCDSCVDCVAIRTNMAADWHTGNAVGPCFMKSGVGYSSKAYSSKGPSGWQTYINERDYLCKDFTAGNTLLQACSPLLFEFNSKAGMEAAGWSFSSCSAGSCFKPQGYGAGAGAVYWGFDYPANMEMSYTFQQSGTVAVKFGNTHTSGIVKLLLNGIVQKSANANTLNQFKQLSVQAGDILSLRDENIAVIAIHSLTFTCGEAPSDSYNEHQGKNAFNTCGATDIESTPTTGETALTCQQRCTRDPHCDCVSFEIGTGKCYKRSNCDQDAFCTQSGYVVFTKATTPFCSNCYIPTGQPLIGGNCVSMLTSTPCSGCEANLTSFHCPSGNCTLGGRICKRPTLALTCNWTAGSYCDVVASHATNKLTMNVSNENACETECKNHASKAGCCLFNQTDNQCKYSEDVVEYVSDPGSHTNAAICSPTTTACPNSNGITGYRFSHNGNFESPEYAGNLNSAAECATLCTARVGCVKFSRIRSGSFKGDCYHYYAAGVAIKYDLHNLDDAYVKCDENAPPSCPNDGGATGYMFSHVGSWLKGGYLVGNFSAIEGCARECDSTTSCTRFHRHVDGNCFLYYDVTSRVLGDLTGAHSSYVKCQAPATVLPVARCVDGKFGQNFCSEWCNNQNAWNHCGNHRLPGSDARNRADVDYVCSCAGCNGCLACADDNNITGYWFNHHGYWSDHYTKVGRFTHVSECASQCTNDHTCLRFNMLRGGSNAGDCYLYSDHNATFTYDPVPNDAYVKCQALAPSVFTTEQVLTPIYALATDANGLCPTGFPKVIQSAFECNHAAGLLNLSYGTAVAKAWNAAQIPPDVGFSTIFCSSTLMVLGRITSQAVEPRRRFARQIAPTPSAQPAHALTASRHVPLETIAAPVRLKRRCVLTVGPSLWNA